MTEQKKPDEHVATVEEFRKNPSAVIERAFTHGSVVVNVGPERDDRIRFVTQQYDLEVD